MKYLFAIVFLAITFSCGNEKQKTEEPTAEQPPAAKMLGSVEKADAALDAIISPDARAEVIAEGFEWSEGALWLEKTNTLIWSDVPTNTIYKWTAEKGKEVYLTPSGYTDTAKRGGEMGSNGLTLDNEGNLILCQHGNRQIAKMNSPVNDPKPVFITLAGNYKGKRFSSPNDAVVSSTGEIYFTDPPYGLAKPEDKELPNNGVYKIKKNGEVVLLVDSISRPNGIALFPGEKRLLVASSDGDKPNWYVYELSEGGGGVKNGRLFYSAEGLDKSIKGLPDGLKIDKNGNVFATGPGGIWIFNNEGKVLGKIKLDESTSNCALSPDEKTLYITNDMNVLRIKMRD
jgi:gluconolactonase